MSRDDQKRWDLRHAQPAHREDAEPRRWLNSNEHLLPRSGRALDLAAGRGQDAVFLAGLGLEVEAIDISGVGIARARELALRRGLSIQTRITDLETNPSPIAADSYDLIICFRYLQRNLAPHIEAGLRAGGLALLELVTRKSLEKRPGRNPEFLIEQEELLGWFPDLTTVLFEENWEGRLHLSRIIARKNKHLES